MEYKKVSMKNYNLYFIKTKKFKTINISLNFKRDVTKEDEVYCAILRRILNYATNQYHNLDDLNRTGMDLYGPTVRLGFVKYGLDRTFYLETTFVNEKYTENGMNEKSIEYFLSRMWDPYVQDGKFNEELFDRCRHEYVEQMSSVKDNPDRYAEERIWEEMKIYPFGEFNAEQCANYAKKLTSKDLYEYYLSLFNNDSLDIFITGDVCEKQMKDIMSKIIKGNFNPSYKNRYIAGRPRNTKKIIEKADTEQSKLIIGLRYADLTDFERKYVSLVYNNILGGGWNSKLNTIVREENSLCYYIYSLRKIPFDMSFIYSGIDAKNADKTIKLIKKQMDKMHEEITDEDLLRVKEIYNNTLTEIEDDQISITNNVISMVLSDTDSIEERRQNIDKVTIEDVKQIASKVYIDTIFLLEGTVTNGKENI